MNILFISGWWPTNDSPAAGIFVKEHALAISKYCSLTVFFLKEVKKSESWKDFPSSFSEEVEIINGNLKIISIAIYLRVRKFGLMNWQISTVLRHLYDKYNSINRFDIIHTNISTTPISLYFLNNIHRYSIPLVHSEHSSFFHTELYDLDLQDQKMAKLKYEKLFSKNGLKYLMPVSNQLGGVLNAYYGLPKNKIVKVPNVANDCFYYLNNNLNENGKIIITTAALWHYPKNPILFLEVLKIIKEKNIGYYNRIKINWIGEGVQMAEVGAFIHDYLTDLDVDFLGMLTKNEIAKYFQKSNFFVHPTDAENLPCIIIEALCTGLPVLTANVNGCIELVDNSNGILFERQSRSDFYSKMIEMLESYTKFDKKNISQTATSKYSYDAVGKQIISIYKSALSGK